MILFRRNFKNNVKNKMMRDKRFIEDLRIIEMTIDLNDKLYEWTLKKQYFKRRQKCDKNYVNHRTYKKKLRYHAIKNIWKKQDLWNWMWCYSENLETKKNNQTKKTTCYAYDKKNHYVKNCKSKNVIRRQFNVTLKKQLRTQTKKK